MCKVIVQLCTFHVNAQNDWFYSYYNKIAIKTKDLQNIYHLQNEMQDFVVKIFEDKQKTSLYSVTELSLLHKTDDNLVSYNNAQDLSLGWCL